MNKHEKQLDIYRSEYIVKLETELEKLKQDFEEEKKQHKYDIEFQNEVVKDLTKQLKLLKKFKTDFDNYELSKKQGFIAYENWQECEKQIKKLEKDVQKHIKAKEKNHDLYKEMRKNSDIWRDAYHSVLIELKKFKQESVGK